MPGLLDIFAGAVAGGAKGHSEALILRLKEEALAAREENLKRFQLGMKGMEIKSSEAIAATRERGETERHAERQKGETTRHEEVMATKRDAAALAEERDKRMSEKLDREHARQKAVDAARLARDEAYYKSRIKDEKITDEVILKLLTAYDVEKKITTDETGGKVEVTTQRQMPDWLRQEAMRRFGDRYVTEQPKQKSALELMLERIEQNKQKK